ncbi:unnamed protein product [Parnassius apollo]|uniref:(apollo) hypothetical protein n=1 Tax=Parnassius apollo TaxID=110799 RepID=A0A8S3XUY2_PARAO|nr:unnamed protein product [Parnassius apollo]
MIYHDRKPVALISTYHNTEQVMVKSKSNLSCQWKPKLAIDYNKYMGSVDRKDRMIPYLLERKSCFKWYLKLFKRLLDVSILNARIHREKSSNESKDHLVFRLELVTEVIDKHITQVPRLRLRRVEVNSIPRRVDLPARRLTDSLHWPASYEHSSKSNRTK